MRNFRHPDGKRILPAEVAEAAPNCHLFRVCRANRLHPLVRPMYTDLPPEVIVVESFRPRQIIQHVLRCVGAGKVESLPVEMKWIVIVVCLLSPRIGRIGWSLDNPDLDIAGG